MVTLDSSTRPVDRFVFEMSVLKSFEGRRQIVEQLPQQKPAITHGNDNNQLEHADEEPNILHHGQDQQSETTAPRFDKGKGKAIEYQHHEMEENEIVDDEDVEVDGAVQKDQYDGYGGDHEQGPEPEQDEQGHHVVVEGEVEGYDEEEYDEEDDDEAPLVRRIRAAQDMRSVTANAKISLAMVQRARERSGYKNRVGQDGGNGRRETPHFGARVDVTTDLETMLRAMLLKISICDAHLTPLAPGKSFEIRNISITGKNTTPKYCDQN